MRQPPRGHWRCARRPGEVKRRRTRPDASVCEPRSSRSLQATDRLRASRRARPRRRLGAWIGFGLCRGLSLRFRSGAEGPRIDTPRVTIEDGRPHGDDGPRVAPGLPDRALGRKQEIARVPSGDSGRARFLVAGSKLRSSRCGRAQGVVCRQSRHRRNDIGPEDRAPREGVAEGPHRRQGE